MARFDLSLIAGGLHTVTGRVELKPRRTVVPPDIFERFAAMEFWKDYRGSHAKVIVSRDAPVAVEAPDRLNGSPNRPAGLFAPTNGALSTAPPS